MFEIEKTTYGLKLVFKGFIEPEEMKKWVRELKKAVDNLPQEFYIFVDMQELTPLPKESQPLLEEGQKYARQNGMVRSVVIISSLISKLQCIRIAKETGIYKWERYIDSSSTANYEKLAMDWLLHAKDPDES